MRNNRPKQQLSALPTPVDPRHQAFWDRVYPRALAAARDRKTPDPDGVASTVARRLCFQWINEPASIRDGTLKELIARAVFFECRKADKRGAEAAQKNFLVLQDGGLVNPRPRTGHEMKAGVRTDDGVIDEEGWRVVDLVIGRMRKKPRRIVYLRVRMGLEIDEIAAALGMKDDTVRQHVRRGLKEVDRVLTPYAIDGRLPRAIERRLHKERQ